MDNATAHPAAEYEREITRTIPLYAEMNRQALDVVRATKPTPARWLDTGCGPGYLAQRAMEQFPSTEFILADPSSAMLALAREHCSALPPSSLSLLRFGSSA